MNDFELTQRRVMGVLVILLPIIPILFGFLGDNNPPCWWYSISDTYYTNSVAVMVGIISIASFFFCTYKGYDWRDRLVNLVSGIGLAGLLIFPITSQGFDKVGLFCLPAKVSGFIHCIFAFTAFTGFFFNLEFLFTLSSGKKTKRKKIRNVIYIVCGSTVILALVIIVLGKLGIGTKNMVWIAETVSLIPCGFAWLVKGKMFKCLNDEDTQNKKSNNFRRF